MAFYRIVSRWADSTDSSYIAYLLAEFPSNWLMQRYPIDRVLAICVAIWGVNLFVTAACKNFTQSKFRVITPADRPVMALRVILGISEAAVLPGFYIMTTAWYRKSEQHLRAQLWMWVAGAESAHD